MSQFNQLSTREWEVIEQLLQGKSNKLIAASLNITVSTVEFHLKNIYEKFNVSSRLELVLALWKATEKVDLTELGYSTVDSMEDSVENGRKQSTYPYGRIRRTMRLYRIVLVACIIVIIAPLMSLIIHKALNPESIIIWRGIITWLLPAAAILILLWFLFRMSFRSLTILASILLLGLIGIGNVNQTRSGLVFTFLDLRYWLAPYFVGAGGILIAAWYRTREPDLDRPDTEQTFSE
jgi:DNA-binding CsgD family transcriptional regulator